MYENESSLVDESGTNLLESATETPKKLNAVMAFLRKYYFAFFLMQMGIQGVLLYELNDKKVFQRDRLRSIPVDMAQYSANTDRIRGILEQNPENVEQLLKDYSHEPHLQLALVDAIEEFRPEWFQYIYQESVQIQAIQKMSYLKKLAPGAISKLMKQASFDTVRIFIKNWILKNKEEDWINEVMNNLGQSPSEYISSIELNQLWDKSE